MNKRLLSLLMLSTPMFAGTIDVMTLSIDPTWTSTSSVEILELGPRIEKTYIANKPSSTLLNNYVYGNHIQHLSAALKVIVFKDLSYAVSQRISGSIGVEFNRANGFHHTPMMSEAVMQNNFTINTQTCFTDTVDVGIQTNLNANWQQASVYEFADWSEVTWV